MLSSQGGEQKNVNLYVDWCRFVAGEVRANIFELTLQNLIYFIMLLSGHFCHLHYGQCRDSKQCYLEWFTPITSFISSSKSRPSLGFPWRI